MRAEWDTYWKAQCYLVATMSTCLTRQTGAVLVRDRRSVATGFNGNVPGARHCDEGGCERCAQRHTQDIEHTAAEGLRTSDNLPARVIAAGDALGSCTCVHAEANAVAQCALYGVSTRGATVYCTTRPCLDCVKLMAVAGVTEVVYDEDYPAQYEVPPTITMRVFADAVLTPDAQVPGGLSTSEVRP